MSNDLKILMKEAVKNCDFEKAEELKNTRNIWQACSDLEASLLEKCTWAVDCAPEKIKYHTKREEFMKCK
jgi:predicted Ser/Thr protein kinase